ncbi:MAG: hypothetical protein PUE95_05095 [Lachnospiraceae bacterium]|nr:hypothetical protein [Lachnospiraceae bacterium]
MQANQAKRHTGKQKQVKKYASKPILSKPIKQKGIPENKSKSRSMPRSRFLASQPSKKAYQIMKASQEVCLGADFMQANQAKRHTGK